MKETRLFYEVNAYVETGIRAHTTFYRLDTYRAEVEDGIATFKKRHRLTPEVVLASSLCWTPGEAFQLHIAQAKLNVSQAEVALDDAKKNLAKAKRAESQWLEAGKETKIEED